MRSRSLRLTLLMASAAFAPPAAAQDIDLSEIFSNRSFYEEHGILRSRGEVDFVGNVWILPATADSARALVGVALSNDALEFVRTSAGTWRAVYGVTVSFQRDGASIVEGSWQRSLDVESFDETGLTGETIVFQTELGVPPGDYEVALAVRDVNGEDSALARADLTVPALAGPALSSPVPLKVHESGSAEFVVHPSHYFPAAPDAFEFLVGVSGLPEGESWRAEARLIPADDRQESTPVWSGEIAPGTARVFASMENDQPRFGEYSLEVVLLDPQGRETGRRAAPLLVAGSSGWIVDHWDDALTLLRYEGTRKEIDILEDIEGAQARLEAWNCFWRMRDPAPTTTANEALQSYFQRVQTANDNWSSALRPGYLSDRGRVFIQIGAPDEIREEPMPRGTRPFEIWTYLRYNFQIYFVDDIGFNNYQLHPESIPAYQRELSLIERRKLRFLQDRAQVCPLLAPAFE